MARRYHQICTETALFFILPPLPSQKLAIFMALTNPKDILLNKENTCRFCEGNGGGNAWNSGIFFVVSVLVRWKLLGVTWLSGSRSLCSFVRGTDDSTGIAVANDMAVYAIRVGGWLSELVGKQRRVGLEEALTLFESVSFIGQLLFVAANALVLERNGRGRRI